MTRVFIGIGSNLQDPVKQVKNALQILQTLPDSVFYGHSSLYKSRPVGPQDQPDFINAVAELDTQMQAGELLDYLQEIENRFGRDRDVERWGPRVLDLDILLFGDQIINTDRICIPHKELLHRDFVLCPLYEIAPDMIIPGGNSLVEYLSDIDPEQIQKL